MTPDASLPPAEDFIPLDGFSLPSWRVRFRLAWAVMRGWPVMSQQAFRWNNDHGWQHCGFVEREDRESKYQRFESCYWDGPLLAHPWTTNPAMEADMLAASTDVEHPHG